MDSSIRPFSFLSFFFYYVVLFFYLCACSSPRRGRRRHPPLAADGIHCAAVTTTSGGGAASARVVVLSPVRPRPVTVHIPLHSLVAATTRRAVQARNPCVVLQLRPAMVTLLRDSHDPHDDAPVVTLTSRRSRPTASDEPPPSVK